MGTKWVQKTAFFLRAKVAQSQRGIRLIFCFCCETAEPLIYKAFRGAGTTAKVQQKYSKNQAFSLYADTDTHTYKTRIKHGTEKAED